MRFGSQTRSIPLIAIAIAAVLFLVISYQYSSYTLSQINTSALDGIHSNAQVQVTDTSGVLVAKLEGIASSVKVAATALGNEGPAGANGLLSVAQIETSGFTADYFWIGSNGTLLAINDGNQESVAAYAGSNYSQRPYFSGAEHANGVYFTGAVPSLSNSSVYHIFLSDAVFGPTESNGTRPFEGVLGAAIDLTTLGTYLQSQVSSGVSGEVGLIDAEANVLYAQNTSLIGQNIFSSKIQSELPSSLAQTLDSVINKSLSGASGYSDIPVQGTEITIAYSPVLLQGVGSVAGSQEFGVLYFIVADTIAGSNSALITQLRVLSSLIIIGIAGISVGAAVIFLGWNKRLDDTVKERTSELLKANEQLTAYAQSQTDFVNIAAHELRTPTQSILGFTEILQDASQQSEGQGAAKVEDSEVREAVTSIGNNARRLKKLTDDILSVSRIEENRMSLSKEKFDLNARVRDVISEVQSASSAGKTNGEQVRIEFEPEQQSLEVFADSSKIHEVLTNLLTNAVRFSEGKGVIVVRTKTQGDEAMVSIRDQGKGIDPIVLPRLFNKFVTTSPSGTGLGLFIASKLVSAHGGKMWARNNGPGQPGSTFEFTLPLDGKAPGSEKKNPS